MRFLPKEEKFFAQFNNQTRAIAQAATILAEGVTQGNSQLKLMAPRIEQLEEEADEILHEVFTRLNETFITPFDPEDIHSLCSQLDDVMDGLEDVAHRIVSYRIDPIPQPVKEVCQLIQACSVELSKAVEALENMPNIQGHCIEINRIEGQIDTLVRQAIVDLFDNETNPVQVIKLKEIYDYLESTADACEDVADVLQGIVVKNS
jgi:predicted phosphate transport protein (TIGR00153 family)